VEIQAESQIVLNSIMNRSSRDAVGSGRDTGPGTYGSKGHYFEGDKTDFNKGKANIVIGPFQKCLAHKSNVCIHTYFLREKANMK
jgi:hypothetical protein